MKHVYQNTEILSQHPALLLIQSNINNFSVLSILYIWYFTFQTLERNQEGIIVFADLIFSKAVYTGVAYAMGIASHSLHGVKVIVL